MTARWPIMTFEISSFNRAIVPGISSIRDVLSDSVRAACSRFIIDKIARKRLTLAFDFGIRPVVGLEHIVSNLDWHAEIRASEALIAVNGCKDGGIDRDDAPVAIKHRASRPALCR